MIDNRFVKWMTGLESNDKNGASFRWENKEVLSQLSILEEKQTNNITLQGVGKYEWNKKITRENTSSLVIHTNTKIEDLSRRPSTTLEIRLDHIDASKYNRISCWVYPESVGHQNFYFHFSLMNQDKTSLLHAPSLVPNCWNHVVWELDEFKRDDLVRLAITPFLMGTPPEGLDLLHVHINGIFLEEVEADYVLGWDVTGKIAYCHSGYLPDTKKQAVLGHAENKEFHVLNDNEELIYIGQGIEEETNLGKFVVLDFSSVQKEGLYYIKAGNIVTPLFRIGIDAYTSSIEKSIHFLKSLRCGDDVLGVHTPCHLNSYVIHPDGGMVPSHGGWHDAGDVSQFEICTAEMAHAILDLAAAVDPSSPLYVSLLEEARWGLLWLLRTRFSDGFRAMAVHYAVWTDNVTDERNFDSSNPRYRNNVAENGPFENFLAACAEAMGYLLFKSIDPIFAQWCRRSAIEDYSFAIHAYKNGIFTKRWGPSIDSQVCGIGATCASLLYKITGDASYLDRGILYADVILLCQQTKKPSWDKPLRGFFYEDCTHQHLLTYEHRGHEQFPVQGLCSMLEVAKDHPNAKRWMEGLLLYKEYVLESLKYTSPYGVLPAHVYSLDKIRLDRFTIPASVPQEKAWNSFKGQIESGIALGDGFYLRIFPIAIQRRGYHATLLSKTKAVSLIAKTLQDESLRQVALDQLEWVLGKNPFASSTMYGEGHNYHPLYVAFSRQMVGSLPVGIKTHEDLDAPYWPTSNNAVFKEIWGHTTGKYLWVLADVLK